MTTHVRFPSPYDIKAPQGAEDWKRLYPTISSSRTI